MMKDVRDLIEDIRHGMTEPRIVAIDEASTTIPGVTKWTVRLDDGRHASTIKWELAREAIRLRGLDVPVEMQRQRRSVGSFTLTAIAPLVTRA